LLPGILGLQWHAHHANIAQRTTYDDKCQRGAGAESLYAVWVRFYMSDGAECSSCSSDWDLASTADASLARADAHGWTVGRPATYYTRRWDASCSIAHEPDALAFACLYGILGGFFWLLVVRAGIGLVKCVLGSIEQSGGPDGPTPVALPVDILPLYGHGLDLADLRADIEFLNRALLPWRRARQLWVLWLAAASLPGVATTVTVALLVCIYMPGADVDMSMVVYRVFMPGALVSAVLLTLVAVRFRRSYRCELVAGKEALSAALAELQDRYASLGLGLGAPWSACESLRRQSDEIWALYGELPHLVVVVLPAPAAVN
jgi:hypothetical protein